MRGSALSTLLVAALFPIAVRAGSNTWTSLGPDGGPVQVLAIDPQNPAVVYAVTPAGLFSSNDAGANWRAMPSAPTAQLLAIDPQNTAVMKPWITVFFPVPIPRGCNRSVTRWGRRTLIDCFENG